MGAGECRIKTVRFVERRAKQNVVAGVFVDRRSTGGQRRFHGAEHRRFLVFDLHEFRCILRRCSDRSPRRRPQLHRQSARDRPACFAPGRLKSRLHDIRRQRANSAGEIAAGVDRVHALDRDAASVSIETMRACACGLRTNVRCKRARRFRDIVDIAAARRARDAYPPCAGSIFRSALLTTSGIHSNARPLVLRRGCRGNGSCRICSGRASCSPPPSPL